MGLALSVLAVGAACRALIHFQPLTRMHVSLSGEVEDFFFEPSDSSPLVVMGLCAWLLWRRRARLASLWGRRGPVALTAACWAAAAAVFTWSVRVDAPDLQALALIPALLGAGNLLAGAASLRVMAFPVSVLVFAIPVPAAALNQVLWFLQIQTADFTGLLLRGIGVPVLVSGDRIILSDGLFAIIETCSGIRSIETLLLLTVLMVDLFGRRGWHAVALFAAAPLVAFFINGLRCLGLIFNPHADIASVHSLQGIAMLLGGVLLLYFLDGALERLGLGRGASPAAPRSQAPRLSRSSLRGRVGWVAAFSALLLGLSFVPRFEPPQLRPASPADVLDARLEGWRYENQGIDWLFLGRTAFGSVANRRYRAGRDPVDVFVAQADPDRRLRMYLSPKVAFPGSGWTIESERRREILGRRVTERVLRKGASRVLVTHWFEDSPGVLRETVRGFLALDSSRYQRERLPLALRLSTPLAGAREADLLRARERLETVIGRLEPGLNELSSPKG